MPGEKKEPFVLLRSRRRTLSMEIKENGDLLVRAPLRMSQRVIEDFVQQKQPWIEKARERVRSRPAPKVLTKEKEQALRALTRERVLPRVAPWADRLGVNPQKVTVTGALTWWGSCSARGHVCFSCLLGEQEDSLIDYVIVHELCHLRHMDHSKRFWQEVGRVIPDWPKRRAKLKQAARYRRPNEQTAPGGS